jgi:hypothetical protein
MLVGVAVVEQSVLMVVLLLVVMVVLVLTLTHLGYLQLVLV